MKKLLTIMVALCLPAVFMAQSPGEIKGKIIDAKTKEALPGASIYVKYMGSIVATTAEKDGSFTLKPLDPGTYNVYVSYVSYDTATYAGINVISDKPTFIDDVELYEAGITIDNPVRIVGQKPIEKGTSGITSIPLKQIKDMPDARQISSILRNMMADVYVSDDGDEIYFRGSRDGDAIFIVDGVKMRDDQLHIPGNAIGNITVYTGGVPANYGDFTGGVVVIETQSYFSWLNDKKAMEAQKKFKL